jgi:hypothetical protein
MVVVHFANRGARRADVGGWCNRFQRINPRGSGAATKEGRSDLTAENAKTAEKGTGGKIIDGKIMKRITNFKERNLAHVIRESRKRSGRVARIIANLKSVAWKTVKTVACAFEVRHGAEAAVLMRIRTPLSKKRSIPEMLNEHRG